MLTSLLDREGFAACFDVVYLPMDFKTSSSLGYAFVNLTSACVAEKFLSHFDNFTNWGIETTKTCTTSWSDAAQGYQLHVEKYRNSPVMHESVPDEFKPIVLAGGERIPFPSPTKRVNPPKLRSHIPVL
jgi:hypothetical protein